MFDNNKIQSFLNGDLAEKESKELQQRIDNDAGFASEVDDYAVLFSGFKALELEELSNQVAGWESKYAQEETISSVSDTKEVKMRPMRSFRRWSMGVAAAIALIILPLGFLFFGQSDQLDSYLAEAHAPSPKRSTSPTLNIRELAYTDFNMDKYKESIPKLEQALVQNKEELSSVTDEEEKTRLTNIRSEINWVLGMAFLKEGNFVKGEEALQTALEITDQSNSADSTEWLLALTLDKNKKDSEALALMTKMSNNTNHEFHKEAKEWLASR